MLLAEEADGVFAEETGLLNLAQSIQILIRNRRILKEFLLPGINEMASRLEFTVETARPRRIIAANLELAGAFHQAVGHPTLESRVVIGEGAGRKVEDIAVRHTIARIDFAAASDKWEKQQKAIKPHVRSIRHQR